METISLKKPIQNGSETLSELHFKEPTAKEMIMLSSSPNYSDLLKIAASLCDLPERVLLKMSVKDTKAVLEKTSFLLADGE